MKSLDLRPRIKIGDLSNRDLPESPGVYALYRDGAAIYVGKAANLRKRVWRAHCGQNKSLRNSAFRRNVAEHLGIATAADIYGHRYRLSPQDLARVREFIETCEVGWLECDTEQMAISLETELKLESKPPLTKL